MQMYSVCNITHMLQLDELQVQMLQERETAREMARGVEDREMRDREQQQHIADLQAAHAGLMSHVF